MRFMVIVKHKDEYGMPSSEQIAEMGAYNERLMEAGVMRAGEGLLPSAKGAIVSFSKSGAKVTDGPFSESKELIGGFWILETATREECLDWVKQIPFEDGEVEVRQVAETEDFVADEISGETLEKEKLWREQLNKRD